MRFISAFILLFLLSCSRNAGTNVLRKITENDASRSFFSFRTQTLTDRPCVCTMMTSCSCCETVRIFYSGDSRRLCFNMIYQMNGLNLEITLDALLAKSTIVANYRPFQMCATVPGLYFTSICITILELNRFTRSISVCPRLEVSNKKDRWQITYTCVSVSTVLPAATMMMPAAMMPGMMPGAMMPGAMTTMRPAMMPGMMPAMMPGMMTAGMMPGMMTTARPAMMAGMMPGMMSGMMPGMMMTARPPGMAAATTARPAGAVPTTARPAAAPGAATTARPAMMSGVPGQMPPMGMGPMPPMGQVPRFAALMQRPDYNPSVGQGSDYSASTEQTPNYGAPMEQSSDYNTPADQAQDYNAPVDQAHDYNIQVEQVSVDYSTGDQMLSRSRDESINDVSENIDGKSKTVTENVVGTLWTTSNQEVTAKASENIESITVSETNKNLTAQDNKVSNNHATQLNTTITDKETVSKTITADESDESSKILKRTRRQNYDMFDIYQQSNRCVRAYKICITRTRQYIVSRVRNSRSESTFNKNRCGNEPARIVYGNYQETNPCPQSSTSDSYDNMMEIIHQPTEMNEPTSQASNPLDAIIVHDESAEGSDFHSQNNPYMHPIVPIASESRPQIFPERTPPLFALQIKEALSRSSNDTLIFDSDPANPHSFDIGDLATATN